MKLEANVWKALLFGALTKAWGVFHIPLQLLLISLYFSPETQGYYYTFQSIIALQVFVELGLSQVILYFTSHEWAALKLGPKGRVSGCETAQARFYQFGRVIFQFYSVGALLLTCVLLFGGSRFLSSISSSEISWFWPWTLLALLAPINLILIPAVTLLEGANQVKQVYLLRFFQSVILGLSTCLGLILGFELWTAPLGLALSILFTLLFLVSKYPTFFLSFLRAQKTPLFSWKKEILPLQRKFALTFLSGYFAFCLFNPLVFHYKGAAAAGQIGMTLMLAQALLNMAMLWIQVSTPQIGILIAKNEGGKLHSLFYRLLSLNALTITLGTSAAWVTLKMLAPQLTFLTQRLLPSPTLEWFLLGNIFMALSLPFSVFMRAHKEEPLLALSWAYALSTALAIFLFAKWGTINEIGIAYASLNIASCLGVIFIWRKFRESKYGKISHSLPS